MPQTTPINNSALRQPPLTRTTLRCAEEQHEMLSRKLPLFPEYTVDPAQRRTFLAEVRTFLETLKPICANLRTTSQYDRVSRIADEWQTALSELFQEPLNVREFIGLSLPSPDLKPSRRLTLDEIQWTLQRRAGDAAEYRKLAQLFAQIDWLYRLSRSPETLHKTLPSSWEEMEQDWAYACQFLAADVLEGRLRVGDQLDLEAFKFLTETWLEDTKRLVAYMRWLSDAHDPQATAMARPDFRYYFDVCESLHAALLDETRKADVDSFGEIAEWIEERYLQCGKVNTLEGSAGWKLVCTKAHRIWEQYPGSGSMANWAAAEAYVRGFYEHIIPAVMCGSIESVRSVLNVVTPQRQGGPACEIINSFEAAIAIEFLDPTLVRNFYHPESSFL